MKTPTVLNKKNPEYNQSFTLWDAHTHTHTHTQNLSKCQISLCVCVLGVSVMTSSWIGCWSQCSAGEWWHQSWSHAPSNPLCISCFTHLSLSLCITVSLCPSSQVWSADWLYELWDWLSYLILKGQFKQLRIQTILHPDWMRRGPSFVSQTYWGRLFTCQLTDVTWVRWVLNGLNFTNV